MQICALTKYLFRCFCADRDLDTETMREATIEQFFNWYHEHAWDLSADTEQRREIIENLKVSEEMCELFHEIMQNPFRADKLLWTLWPILCLSGKRPLRHGVRRLELIMQIDFDDDRRLSLVGQTVMLPEEAVTEGQVVALLRGQSLELSAQLAERGLDALHEYSMPLPPASLPDLEFKIDVEEHRKAFAEWRDREIRERQRERRQAEFRAMGESLRPPEPESELDPEGGQE